jgi:hypothetical protein
MKSGREVADEVDIRRPWEIVRILGTSDHETLVCKPMRSSDEKLL